MHLTARHMTSVLALVAGFFFFLSQIFGPYALTLWGLAVGCLLLALALSVKDTYAVYRISWRFMVVAILAIVSTAFIVGIFASLFWSIWTRR